MTRNEVSSTDLHSKFFRNTHCVKTTFFGSKIDIFRNMISSSFTFTYVMLEISLEYENIFGQNVDF